MSDLGIVNDRYAAEAHLFAHSEHAGVLLEHHARQRLQGLGLRLGDELLHQVPPKPLPFEIGTDQDCELTVPQIGIKCHNRSLLYHHCDRVFRCLRRY